MKVKRKALIGIQVAPMHFMGTFCSSHLRIKLESVKLGPYFISFCGSNESSQIDTIKTQLRNI